MEMCTLRLREDFDQTQLETKTLCLGYTKIALLFNAGPFPGGGDCLIVRADGELVAINSNDLIHDLEAYRIEDWKPEGEEHDEHDTCYVHAVADPNETPFDPAKHSICQICAAKLWELARGNLEFDMRESTVSVSLKPLKDQNSAKNRTKGQRGR